jgi:aspartate kinase
MHPRAVELGWIYNIPIRVANSFNENSGTLIHGDVKMEIRNKVTGITHDLNVAKITVVGVPDRPGIAAAIFKPLAETGISVDNIVQNASINNITDLSFTVTRSDLSRVTAIVQPVADEIGARQFLTDDNVGKISIIGAGIQNSPGYAARMFSALSDKGINIELITTSEIRITCIIDKTQVNEAVKSLHRAFRLEQVK